MGKPKKAHQSLLCFLLPWLYHCNSKMMYDHMVWSIGWIAINNKQWWTDLRSLMSFPCRIALTGLLKIVILCSSKQSWSGCELQSSISNSLKSTDSFQYVLRMWNVFTILTFHKVMPSPCLPSLLNCTVKWATAHSLILTSTKLLAATALVRFSY